MITLTCRQCQRTLLDYPSTTRQCCSRACAILYASLHPRIYSSNKLTGTCKFCQKPITFYPSRVRQFCSHACGLAYRRTQLVLDAQASKSTLARRKKAAGLSKMLIHRRINEDFFMQWSDDLAWVLGLIWSDGCLKSNRIEVCNTDFAMLMTMSQLMKHSHGPTTYRQKKSAKPFWRLIFNSKRVATHLRSLGLHERKSHSITWPQIPQEHEAAFVRGLLDGDGWASFRIYRKGQRVPDLHVGLCGASPLRHNIEQWLANHDIPYYSTVKRGTTVWRITVVQQRALRALYLLLYPSLDVPCLQRKHQAFIQWLITPRARAGAPKRDASFLQNF